MELESVHISDRDPENDGSEKRKRDINFPYPSTVIVVSFTDSTPF
jgi:hypothetical protein